MSFQFDLEPKEEAAAELIAAVGQRLQEVLVEHKAIDGLTQQELATRLGVNRAQVNRCFSGYHNLTLRSLAELVWALDAEIKIEIAMPAGQPGTNFSPNIVHEATPSQSAQALMRVAQPETEPAASTSKLPVVRLQVTMP